MIWIMLAIASCRRDILFKILSFLTWCSVLQFHVINYSSRCLPRCDLFMHYTLTESFCEADLFSKISWLIQLPIFDIFRQLSIVSSTRKVIRKHAKPYFLLVSTNISFSFRHCFFFLFSFETRWAWLVIQPYHSQCCLKDIAKSFSKCFETTMKTRSWVCSRATKLKQSQHGIARMYRSTAKWILKRQKIDPVFNNQYLIVYL